MPTNVKDLVLIMSFHSLIERQVLRKSNFQSIIYQRNDQEFPNLLVQLSSDYLKCLWKKVLKSETNTYHQIHRFQTQVKSLRGTCQ